MYKKIIDIKNEFTGVDRSNFYFAFSEFNIPVQSQMACHRQYLSIMGFNPHLMIGSATPHVELNGLAGRQVHWLPQGEEDGEPAVMARVQTQVLTNKVAK